MRVALGFFALANLYVLIASAVTETWGAFVLSLATLGIIVLSWRRPE